jgi:hypothetical protein
MQHHDYLVDMDPVYRTNRRIIEANTKNARIGARTTILRIPVVVHVLYHTDAENIGADQIESQIATLNRDYRMQNLDRGDTPEPFRVFAADPLIEFSLAVRDPQGNPTSGVTRTRTPKSVFPYDQSDPLATKKLDDMIKFDAFGRPAWPRDSYLNLWVCSLGAGLLGYAQFPGGAAATDGVVVGNTAFGSGGIATAPYNLGRTAVHEVGHWLNLLHIWGDDDEGCVRSDNVSDTPNQAGSNGSSVRKSSFPHVTCNNGPHGDMFMNYMDYVDDDTMVMFTRGQVARMSATLAGPRASLATSQGLTPIDTPRVDGDGALRRSLDVLSVIGDERGVRPGFEFDGVSWVSVE